MVRKRCNGNIFWRFETSELTRYDCKKYFCEISARGVRAKNDKSYTTVQIYILGQLTPKKLSYYLLFFLYCPIIYSLFIGQIRPKICICTVARGSLCETLRATFHFKSIAV